MLKFKRRKTIDAKASEGAASGGGNGSAAAASGGGVRDGLAAPTAPTASTAPTMSASTASTTKVHHADNSRNTNQPNSETTEASPFAFLVDAAVSRQAQKPPTMPPGDQATARTVPALARPPAMDQTSPRSIHQHQQQPNQLNPFVQANARRNSQGNGQPTNEPAFLQNLSAALPGGGPIVNALRNATHCRTAAPATDQPNVSSTAPAVTTPRMVACTETLPINASPASQPAQHMPPVDVTMQAIHRIFLQQQATQVTAPPPAPAAPAPATPHPLMLNPQQNLLQSFLMQAALNQTLTPVARSTTGVAQDSNQPSQNVNVQHHEMQQQVSQNPFILQMMQQQQQQQRYHQQQQQQHQQQQPTNNNNSNPLGMLANSPMAAFSTLALLSGQPMAAPDSMAAATAIIAGAALASASGAPNPQTQPTNHPGGQPPPATPNGLATARKPSNLAALHSATATNQSTNNTSGSGDAMGLSQKRSFSSLANGSESASSSSTNRPIRLPCRARGMPMHHNIKTAFFELQPTIKHGANLVCSHPLCHDSGIKFRYCAFCNAPVAKRNFGNRHRHRDQMQSMAAASLAPAPPPPQPSPERPSTLLVPVKSSSANKTHEQNSIGKSDTSTTMSSLQCHPVDAPRTVTLPVSSSGVKAKNRATKKSRNGEKNRSAGVRAKTPSGPPKEVRSKTRHAKRDVRVDGQRPGNSRSRKDQRKKRPPLPGIDHAAVQNNPFLRILLTEAETFDTKFWRKRRKYTPLTSVDALHQPDPALAASEHQGRSGNTANVNATTHNNGGTTAEWKVTNRERSRRWAKLLRKRPKEMNSDEMSQWLVDVMAISDLMKPVDNKRGRKVSTCREAHLLTDKDSSDSGVEKKHRGSVLGEEARSAKSAKVA